MADSLLDLESVPYFSWTPNWTSLPNAALDLARLLTEYPGTVQILDRITDDVPLSFTGTFLLDTRATEYAILDFFIARRGRLERFWVQHPVKCFTLKATAGSGSTAMRCSPNRAPDVFSGVERIYIHMKSGDVLTRQVSSATYDTINDEVDLVLASPLDRAITTTNHDGFGRLLLARFDNDALVQKIESDGVGEVDLGFQELVREYAEL